MIGASLIAYTALPFGALPVVDWIFFYSKKGVEFFFKGLKMPLSPAIRLATMGAGTARVLLDHGYPATFIGTGEPRETAQLFLEEAASQRVLFPRATTSMRSIQTLLKQKIEVHDLLVYTNTPITSFQIDKASHLVFTSPLNVHAYFSNYSYEGQSVVAIGPTTANALDRLRIPNKIAIAPTEKALVSEVLGR